MHNIGDIRLVGGFYKYEGRVEVFFNNTWGTVCDDSWDMADAQVVCRQLGYSTNNAEAFNSAYFGQGTGSIFLSDVICDGTEYSLKDCSYTSYNNCSHSGDAGVRCGKFKMTYIYTYKHVIITYQ